MRGKYYQTSLALDDIKLKHGECRPFPQPPPPPTTTQKPTKKPKSTAETTKFTAIPLTTEPLDQLSIKKLQWRPHPKVAEFTKTGKGNLIPKLRVWSQDTFGADNGGQCRGEMKVESGRELEADYSLRNIQ